MSGLTAAFRTYSDRLTERRAQLAAGAALLAGICMAAAWAVAQGRLSDIMLTGGLVALPALLYIVWRFPFVLPYGLYVVLVPFDDVLVIPGGGTITRMLALGCIGALVVYTARLRRIINPPAALYLFAGFYLWVVIETLRTPDFDEATKTLATFSLLLLFFAVGSLAPIRQSQLRFICGAVVLSGVIASAYGLYMFHLHPELLAKSVGRFTIDLNGRTLDPNGFADGLLAPFALALVSLLNARKPVKVLGMLLVTAFLFGAIVASQSREAWLAIIPLLGVLVWFSRHRLVGLVSGMVAVVAVPLAFPWILERMTNGFQTGGAGRTSIWKVDLLAYLQHPILGWGTGSSIVAYDRNYLRIFQFYNAGWSRPPHNTALFLAVEFGVIGALLFVAGYVALFRPLAQIRRGDSLYDLRVGLTASLAALTVAAMFVDVSPHKDFWLILAATAQLRTVFLTRRSVDPAAVVYEPPVAVAAAAAGAVSARARRPMFRNGNSI